MASFLEEKLLGWHHTSFEEHIIVWVGERGVPDKNADAEREHLMLVGELLQMEMTSGSRHSYSAIKSEA